MESLYGLQGLRFRPLESGAPGDYIGMLYGYCRD